MAEAIGLALAVLPLLISAAEFYRENLDSLQPLRPKAGDDRMLEFYEDVAFEIFMLRSILKKLVKDLPGFSMGYKRKLLRSAEPESWIDEALSAALQTKLGETNYSLFEMTLRRLLESLNALLSSNQQLLSSSQVIDENALCVKLSIFRKEVIAGKTLSTLRGRVQFTTSHHKRAKYLAKVMKYNERLQKLLEGASQADIAEFDHRIKFPSSKIREMAHTLHDALSQSLACSCKIIHEKELFEAKLCLAHDPSLENSFEFSFDMLFSTRPQIEASLEKFDYWQESVIYTEPKVKLSSKPQNKQVGSICELVEAARGHEICLQMLLDNQKLWQIKPQGKRLNPIRSISLEAILLGSTGLRLREKRILAVALAKTVLQLSEGPWLRKKWTPAQISFFENTQNTINFERPYLSTQFKDETKFYEDSAFDSLCIHAIPSLLSLGKLLLEIDKGTKIEITPLDLTDGKHPNANTELTATTRFFKEASGDFYIDYTKAIKACLEPNFLRMDQTGGLDDEEVRHLVYEHVVVPLESELYNGFQVKVSGF